MRIWENIRARMSLGSERLAEQGYFENPLRRSRQFQSLTIWTASAIALGLFIIIRYWSTLSLFLVVMLTYALISVPATWMDAIRDHKRIHAAIRAKSPDELARQALNLAAGQAFALSFSVFFITVVLFVLAFLLARLKGR
jgi:hypothetical protein